MSDLHLNRFGPIVDLADPYPKLGFVTDVVGLVIEAYCPSAQVGSVFQIETENRSSWIEAEVVGFRLDKTLLMPLDEMKGLRRGAKLRQLRKAATLRVGPELMGRVLDGRGRPLDGKPDAQCEEEFYLYSSPINPLRRSRIQEPLDLGIRAINSMISVGKGMRLGIMAGSGVGKSVLLGMMAKSSSAHVNVIGMVGERGRELREFVEEVLGEEGMARSIVVCATSDMPALVRMRAAFVATTIAEYFRSTGKDVLLMMDSVSRFAMAQREVGLSTGEPPTTKGYPPSVFSTLPRIFERVGGLQSGGSITGIYTVLTEGDEVNDVIGDAVRSIVDGHLILSRKLAARGHFPAIDVSNSTSRVMPSITTQEHLGYSARIRKIIASYAEAEDLINIGAYVKGSNPQIDEAIRYIGPIRKFLTQAMDERASFEQSRLEMQRIFAEKSGAAQKSEATG
ncbi:MAG: FliI/YscN family ATPase [Bradymonadales bacterium]|nr:MAG: FliI/YscN family ATPase [Bradymonadales bacterium]